MTTSTSPKSKKKAVETWDPWVFLYRVRENDWRMSVFYINEKVAKASAKGFKKYHPHIKETVVVRFKGSGLKQPKPVRGHLLPWVTTPKDDGEFEVT